MNPIWLAHIFQMGGLKPPTRMGWTGQGVSLVPQIWCGSHRPTKVVPKFFSEAVVAGPSFGTLQVGKTWWKINRQVGWVVSSCRLAWYFNDMTCRWNLSHQNCNGHSLLQMNCLVELGFVISFSLAFRGCYLLAFLNSTLAVNQGNMFLKFIRKCCQRVVNNSSDS